MEKIKFGNYALIKMDVQEYNETYDCNAQEVLADYVKQVAWVEKYDDNGELTAMSMENMYVLEGGSLGFTSRGVLIEDADLSTCMEVIMWLEEL